MQSAPGPKSPIITPNLSPLLLCWPWLWVTLEKKSRNIHTCFLETRYNQAKHKPRVEGYMACSSAELALSRGFLSWEPFRLRAHTCPDSKECWVSKEALGKSSAYLYPYWPFPAWHTGASADTFLISAKNWVLRAKWCSPLGLHSYPALHSQLCGLGPVTLTYEGLIPICKAFLALAAHLSY